MAFQEETMTAGADSSARSGHPSPERRGRVIQIQPPLDREGAFARARKRSALVRFLRKAILIGVTSTVAAMIVIAIFNPFATKFGSLGFSALSLDGSKIAMERPKLAGFRSDGQPYALTAERALQDVKNPTKVELQKLVGEIGMADGETTRVHANAGVYDSASERMRLSGDVRIGNSKFEVWLRTADIDFKSGVYASGEPVEVHVGQNATINGDRAVARNNGQEFTFEGHVRTRITQQANAEADVKKDDP
ncbi:MAG TPA: LPS export ABC transporter periplasmic protein LptC [Roseiarcus sp.]|nr:LPS export ABC transporter periplasmic protein LptC [Roseiarcus sp.]